MIYQENLILETSFWKVPAWELPLHAVDAIEVFTISGRKIIQEKGWPASFWPHVENRCRLNDSEVHQVLALFQHLELDEPARCHLPAWGLGFYRKSELLCTVTLCFECSNAYIYTGSGKVLRAFNVSEINAVALFKFLKKRLPVIEE